MKAFPVASVTLLLISNVFAQQINYVDLTRPAMPSEASENLPDGCKELSPAAIVDGWREPEDHAPHNIVVEVLSVRSTTPVLGSEVGAEVRLRNSDTRPIKIPWSTDLRTIEKGQGPDTLKWEEGTFEFMLEDRQGHQVSLKSLTESLYGSEFAAESELTLKSGESITALVKFVLEDEFSSRPLRLKAGEWQLSAKWSQAGRSWHVRNCKASNGYFQYERFYQQQNPGMVIQVGSSRPVTSHMPPE
jgi:hypothetical protein